MAQSSPVHMAKALQSDCVGEIFQARCTALRCYLTLGDGIQPLRFQPVTFTQMFSAKIYTISGRLPKWLRGYKMIKLNRPTEFSRIYLAQICSKIRWFLLCHQCIVWALKNIQIWQWNVLGLISFTNIDKIKIKCHSKAGRRYHSQMIFLIW